MRQLQGQTEKSISEFWIIGDIENLVNYSCRIAAMQNSPTAALHDQHYDHYIPDELHQEEGKELIGLKDIQSFGIQNGLQNVKVIKRMNRKDMAMIPSSGYVKYSSMVWQMSQSRLCMLDTCLIAYSGLRRMTEVTLYRFMGVLIKFRRRCE